jgi:hypothetical protein
MVRHIVLVRFRPEMTESAIAAILDELHRIQGKVPSMLGIVSGRSRSPERIERGYMNGFVADFADWAALAAYQAHPEHRRVAAKLVDGAAGGIDGILVFDLPVADLAQPVA